MTNATDGLPLRLVSTAGLVIREGSTGNATVSESGQSGTKRLETRFSRQFGVNYPFVCAGMAFVCDTPDLAIAVCRAGGFGSLAGTLLSPATLEAHVAEIRSRSDGPFHVNLLTPFPIQDQVRVCCELGVPAVSFHWGIPDTSLVDTLRAAGVSVWMQVGSASDAKLALQNGADCVVVQGSEAGGHNYGSLRLKDLLSSVRDDLGSEPLLLGAGGIADGSTAAAAFAAGADGVLVGTRMIATDEANAHEEHKRRLIQATSDETVLTSVYGPELPGFNPIRVIRNATTEEWEKKIAEIPVDRADMPSIGTTVFAEQLKEVKPFDSFSPVPETTGNFDQMPMMSGEGVGLIKDISPAAQVMARLMDGAALELYSRYGD